MQPDVTVDAGSDVKAEVEMGEGQKPYIVDISATSGSLQDVVIEYEQDCLGLSSCEPADVDFSELPTGVNAVFEEGRIVLTGDYAAILSAMQKLVIAPGLGNPSPINVKVTATDVDGVTSNFDSFIIPVNAVSPPAVSRMPIYTLATIFSIF